MNIIEVINTLVGLYHSTGATQKQIRHAEEALGLSFAPEYKEYLAQFGYISAGSMELCGIGTDHIDIIEETQYTRDMSQVFDTFPDNLYAVDSLGIGGIVIVQSATGEIYETAPNFPPNKIFDSLAEYIQKDYIEQEDD